MPSDATSCSFIVPVMRKWLFSLLCLLWDSSRFCKLLRTLKRPDPLPLLLPTNTEIEAPINNITHLNIAMTTDGLQGSYGNVSIASVSGYDSALEKPGDKNHNRKSLPLIQCASGFVMLVLIKLDLQRPEPQILAITHNGVFWVQQITTKFCALLCED